MHCGIRNCPHKSFIGCFFILFICLLSWFFVQTGAVDDCLPDLLRSGPAGTWEWSNNHLQSRR